MKVQLNKISGMSPQTYEVSENSTFVQDNIKRYTNPYEDQQTYCQRSFGKPMAKEVIPINGTNLYEPRSTGEDDLEMEFKHRADSGSDQVNTWPSETLFDKEEYRHNLNEGYAAGRTAAHAFDNLLPEKNLISTYAKSKYLDTGRKNGGKPKSMKEGYISYPLEDGDQENLWSSSSQQLHTTLPEATEEAFTVLGKEYNFIDIIECIIIIILLVLFGMLVYAKLTKDKCVFKDNKYLSWVCDLVN